MKKIIIIILIIVLILILYNNCQYYTLSLLVICKNESMVIEEFIEHYLSEGVQHIYIIDNGSTDDTKDKIKKYSKYITYYYKPESHKQTDHYNNVYNQIKHKTKWLIVADVDEYIYNTSKNQTIYDYISTLDKNKIAAVRLNWKMFGSSGYINHPESIRKSFIWRQNDLHQNTKEIINTSLTKSLIIHTHEYKPNVEIIQNPSELQLNHYAIMSEEYFRKIKMTRGDASSGSVDNIRDMNYFNSYDFKEIMDEELKNLI
jgi:cellulose synthase/poly-beta-1,6-N-acetylglucosamine synthase-like glycosyltransferase